MNSEHLRALFKCHERSWLLLHLNKHSVHWCVNFTVIVIPIYVQRSLAGYSQTRLKQLSTHNNTEDLQFILLFQKSGVNIIFTAHLQLSHR